MINRIVEIEELTGFSCTDCGFKNHVDIVGAMNLKTLWVGESL